LPTDTQNNIAFELADKVGIEPLLRESTILLSALQKPSVGLQKTGQRRMRDVGVFIRSDSAYTRVIFRKQTLNQNEEVFQIEALDTVEIRSETILDNLLD